MGERELDLPQDRGETLGSVPVVGLSWPQQRLLRRIRTRKGRAAEAVVLLEGPRVIRTAVQYGAEIPFVVVEEAESAIATLAQVGLASSSETDVVQVPKGGLKEFVGTQSPRGIVAVAREPRPDLPTPASMRGASEPSHALILDGVQDPGNAGTLVRAAGALGVDRVFALDGTADLWGAKAVRSSAGFAFRTPIHALEWQSSDAWLEAAGVPLIVADVHGQDVREWLRTPAGRKICGIGQLGSPWALLIGNETAGPRREAIGTAIARLSIPVVTGVDSLNAAMAGSILLWILGPATDPEARRWK